MVDERYTSDDVRDEIDDESGSSFLSNTGALPLGLPDRTGSETKPDEYGDQPHDDSTRGLPGDETSAGRTSGQTSDDSWAEEGLATLLVVVGVVLFLIPEPATSALGALLVVTGVVLWVVDWLS